MDSPTRGLAGLDFSPYLQPPLDVAPGAYPLPEPPPDIPLDVAEDIMAAQLAAGFELGRKAADEVLREAAAGHRIGVVHVPGGLLRQPFIAAFDARCAERWSEVLEKRAQAEKAEAEAVADFASDLDPAPTVVVKRERTPVAESEPATLVRVQRSIEAAFDTKGLSSTELLVLLSMVWRLRGSPGGANLTQREIAETCRFTTRAVRGAMKRLAELGLVSYEQDGQQGNFVRVHVG